MERADQIMERMGFRKDSSQAVQVAFIKSLIKKTYGVDVRTPLRLEPAETHAPAASRPAQPQQMSFDFEKVG